MDNNIAIKVENLSKAYKLYDKPIDRLKEALHPFKKKYHRDFYALNNVSFEIKKGETVGIIGKNGSGKSTLLKIITGVLSPTSGTVSVNGKVSALLELGAGFNPEYTGMQNIYLNGTMMGYTKEEMDEKVSAIVEFADIGDFINQPVKMYSSGMFVRLAFAVAINVEPDILIVDEALAVGDIRFQQKCIRRMKEFKKKGTILFVSHDTNSIANFCDRVLWIDEGEKLRDGKPDVICEEYHAYMNYNNLAETHCNNRIYENEDIDFQIDPLIDGLSVFGNGDARIIGANLCENQTKTKVQTVKGGEKLDLIFKTYVNNEIDFPIIGFIIKDKLGNEIINVNTVSEGILLNPLKKDKVYIFKWSFNLPKIKDGLYSIDIAIANGTIENHVQNYWVNDVLIIEVRKTSYSRNSNEGLIILDNIGFEVIA